MIRSLIITTACILTIISTARAQKLPATQSSSVYAPTNIKIDGKANEWGDQFQAFNKNTGLKYTLANDGVYLYLLVRAESPRIIEKSLCSGITLAVRTDGKDNFKLPGAFAITYPIIDYDRYARGILVSAGDKDNWPGLPSYAPRPQTSLTRTDSSVAVANKVFQANAKEIKISGAQGITDSLISVYNDYNIKAAAYFGNDGFYTYELAVPLKVIGLTDTSAQKFDYNIRLNDWGNAFNFNTYRYRDPATGRRGDDMDGDADLNSLTELKAKGVLSKK